MALEARVLLSRLKARFVKVLIRATAMELREDCRIEHRRGSELCNRRGDCKSTYLVDSERKSSVKLSEKSVGSLRCALRRVVLLVHLDGSFDLPFLNGEVSGGIESTSALKEILEEISERRGSASVVLVPSRRERLDSRTYSEEGFKTEIFHELDLLIEIRKEGGCVPARNKRERGQREITRTSK